MHNDAMFGVAQAPCNLVGEAPYQILLPTEYAGSWLQRAIL